MAAWMLPVGLAAVGALSGRAQAKAQQDANRRSMLANAAAIEYSPWTGVNPGMMSAQPSSVFGSTLGGAAQGATTGLMFGQQFGEKPLPPMADGSGPLPELQRPESSLYGNKSPWLYMNKGPRG